MIGICSTEYIDVESLPNYAEYDYRVSYPKDTTNKSVFLFLKGVATKSSCIKVYIDNKFLEDETLKDKIALIESKCVMFNGISDLMDILNSYSKQDENSYLDNVIESLDMESLVDDAVKASTEQLNVVNTELTEQNTTLVEEKKNLEVKIQELEDSLSALKAKNAELEQDKDKLDKRYDALSKQIEQKDEQYANLENLYKQKVQQLSEQSSPMVGVPMGSINVSDIMLEGNGDNQTNVANMQQTIDMLELQVSKMSTIEKEAEQAKDAYEELSEAYNKVEAEKDKLFEEIETLKGQLNGYESQLEAVKGSQSEDASKVSSLNFELLDLKEQNKTLSDSVKEKLVEIADLQERLHEITTLTERITELEKSLEDEKAKTVEVEKQREDIEQSIFPVKSQLSEAISKVSQLETENRDLTQQVNSLMTNFAESQTQGTQIITEKKRLEEDLETVRNQLQDSKSKASELNNLNVRLTTERDEALSSIQALKAKIDDMTVQVENAMQLQSEVNSLKSELEKSKASITANTEFTELRLKFETLQQDYTKMEATLSDKLYKTQTELTESNNLRVSLEQRIKNMQQGSGGYSPLDKYDSYVMNPFMEFNERLTMGEQSKINGLDLSNISVCAMGAGSSVAFMSEFTNAWNNWPINTLIIDLSNNKMCYTGIPADVRKSMDKAQARVNATLNIQGMITAKPNVHIFTNDKFNDISLLAMDFGDFLTQVSEAACNQPVIILLGELSSFANRVAFVKLASVCKSFVFIHALSVAMLDAVSEIKSMAATLCNCTALVLHSTMRLSGNNNNMQIINNSSQTIINALSQYVRVHVVPGAIDWVQMGII